MFNGIHKGSRHAYEMLMTYQESLKGGKELCPHFDGGWKFQFQSWILENWQ